MRGIFASIVIGAVVNGQKVDAADAAIVRDSEGSVALAADLSSIDLVLASAAQQAFGAAFTPALNVASSFTRSSLTILFDLLTCRPAQVAPTRFYAIVKDTIDSFADSSGKIKQAVDISEFISRLRENMEELSPVDFAQLYKLGEDLTSIVFNYPFVTVGAYLEYLAQVLVTVESLLDTPTPTLAPSTIPLKTSAVKVDAIKPIVPGPIERMYHPTVWDFNKYGFTGAINSGIWAIPQAIHELMDDVSRSTQLIPWLINTTPDDRFKKTEQVDGVTDLQYNDDGQVADSPMTTVPPPTEEISAAPGSPANSIYQNGSGITITYDGQQTFIPSSIASLHDSLYEKLKNILDAGAAIRDNVTQTLTAGNLRGSPSGSDGMSAPRANILGPWQTLFNPVHSGLNSLGAFSNAKAAIKDTYNAKVGEQVTDQTEETTEPAEFQQFVWSIPDAAIFLLQRIELFKAPSMSSEEFFTTISDIISTLGSSVSPIEFLKNIVDELASENVPSSVRDAAVVFISNSMNGPFPDFSAILDHIKDVIDSRITLS